MRSTRLFGSLFALLLVLHPAAASAITIEEAGWALEYQISFTNAQAARIADDGTIYVARFAPQGGANDGGVYRIDDNVTGASTQLEAANRPRGLAIDPTTGDVFYSTPTGFGTIRMVGDPTPPWAQGFHSTPPGSACNNPSCDADPIGLAIAPLDYSGNVLPLSPGQALFADEGTGGPAEIWRWNASVPNEQELIIPDGSLVKPVDVAIGSDSIYIADQGFDPDVGALLRLDVDPSPGGTFMVTELDLEDSSMNPLTLGSPMAVAVDPLTGDIIVADALTDSVYRVSALENGNGTHTTTLLASGFDFRGNNDGPIEASGLGFSTFGDRLLITERTAGTIYVLSMVPEPGSLLLVVSALAGMARAARRRGVA